VLRKIGGELGYVSVEIIADFQDLELPDERVASAFGA